MLTERQASELLKEMRKRTGLTQKQLGQAVGVNERTIMDGENVGMTRIPEGLTVLRVLEVADALPIAVEERKSPLATIEEKVDEILSGIGDVLALLDSDEGDAGAQGESRS